MAYLIAHWSFSVALVIVLCCRLTESAQRPLEPEKDNNCVPVHTVTKDYRTWDGGDRVFVCQLGGGQFDVFSYEKNQEIAHFGASDVVFKELWALSIRFTIPGVSYSRFTFSHIRHARKFYAHVKPGSRILPQNFTIQGLDKIAGGNRTTVTNNQLIFHQHFIDSSTTKFTFEAADGARGAPPLTFLKDKFQVVLFRPYKDVILTTRDNPSSYHILKFGDGETAGEFMIYVVSFLDFEIEYTFPQGYDG